MIFPGFPGVLSFFQVFQVEWEPCKLNMHIHRRNARFRLQSKNTKRNELVNFQFIFVHAMQNGQAIPFDVYFILQDSLTILFLRKLSV